jgi:hypothetical protein
MTWLRWNCSSISTVSPVGSTVDALFQKAVYIVKMPLKMGEIIGRNIYSRFKRINKKEVCCILLVTYIIVAVYTAVYTVKMLLKMGEIIARNM